MPLFSFRARNRGRDLFSFVCYYLVRRGNEDEPGACAAGFYQAFATKRT